MLDGEIPVLPTRASMLSVRPVLSAGMDELNDPPHAHAGTLLVGAGEGEPLVPYRIGDIAPPSPFSEIKAGFYPDTAREAYPHWGSPRANKGSA